MRPMFPLVWRKIKFRIKLKTDKTKVMQNDNEESHVNIVVDGKALEKSNILDALEI